LSGSLLWIELMKILMEYIISLEYLYGSLLLSTDFLPFDSYFLFLYFVFPFILLFFYYYYFYPVTTPIYNNQTLLFIALLSWKSTYYISIKYHLNYQNIILYYSLNYYPINYIYHSSYRFASLNLLYLIRLISWHRLTIHLIRLKQYRLAIYTIHTSLHYLAPFNYYYLLRLILAHSWHRLTTLTTLNIASSLSFNHISAS